MERFSYGREDGERLGGEKRRFFLAVPRGSALDSPAMPGERNESIWMKLAKLDHCCHVEIRSLNAGEGKREWEVEIRRRDPSGLVRVRDLVLVEAVQRALIQAEVRGWPAAAPRSNPQAGRTAGGEPASRPPEVPDTQRRDAER